MQLTAAFIVLLNTLVGLYIVILMLRLLFQLVRADFYNPVSQAILKLTSPLAAPLRRLLPAMGRIDTSTLVLALLFQALLVVVIFLIRGAELAVLPVLGWTVLALVQRLMDIYTVALILVVIISWVAPGERHPVPLLAHQLTEPLLRPVRRAVPPIAGLDFSVMFVLLALYVVGAFFLPPLPW